MPGVSLGQEIVSRYFDTMFPPAFCARSSAPPANRLIAPYLAAQPFFSPRSATPTLTVSDQRAAEEPDLPFPPFAAALALTGNRKSSMVPRTRSRSPRTSAPPRGALGATFMAFALRTPGAPEAMAPNVRSIVADLDPNLPVYDLFPLDRAISEATWAFDLFGGLFALFGAAALLLAAVGHYGVMAFSVEQRRQEMGVRMALGADRDTILKLVLGKGTRQLALGITLGLLMGAAMAGPMQFILYGVEVGDPVVYASIVVTLAVAGLVACLVPARAASRVDPMASMRTQ